MSKMEKQQMLEFLKQIKKAIDEDADFLNPQKIEQTLGLKVVEWNEQVFELEKYRFIKNRAIQWTLKLLNITSETKFINEDTVTNFNFSYGTEIKDNEINFGLNIKNINEIISISMNDVYSIFGKGEYKSFHYLAPTLGRNGVLGSNISIWQHVANYQFENHNKTIYMHFDCTETEINPNNKLKGLGIGYKILN